MSWSSRGPSLLRRNRDFRYLFLARLAGAGAYWFVQVPLLVLLHELTGGGQWGALSLAAGTGVYGVLLPFAGSVADRFDRRRIMIVANLVNILAVLALFAVRSSATAWLGVAVSGSVAAASAFYLPAASAALPNLVPPPDLKAANVVAGSAFGTMSILGASLGGLLVAVFHPYVPFLLTVVALVVGTGLVTRIDRPFQSGRQGVHRSRAWSGIKDGFHYIVRRPRVRALVTVKSAVGLGNGALAIYPMLAASFGAGATGTGLLFAARGVGILIGPFLLRRVPSDSRLLLPVLALSMSVFGLSYVSAALAGWFPLILMLMVVAHVAASGNWTMSSYALQAKVPDEFLGRVTAADAMLSALAMSCSQLVVGALIDSSNIRVLMAGCGSITILYAVGWRISTAVSRREARSPTATLR